VSLRSAPAISGTRVVWKEGNGSDDIYFYDAATNGPIRKLTTHTLTRTRPRISGPRVVWQDLAGTQVGIHVYDVTTNQDRRISTNSGPSGTPAIEGERLVWMGISGPNVDLYLYDLRTDQESRLTSHPTQQIYPTMSGNRIVWVDQRLGTWSLWSCEYDPVTGACLNQLLVPNYYSYTQRPHLSGSRLVGYNGRDVVLYDAAEPAAGVQPITNDPGGEGAPAIDGRRIVYQETTPAPPYSFFWDVYLVDLNRPPVIAPVADQFVRVGRTLSVPVSVSDADGDLDLFTGQEDGTLAFSQNVAELTGDGAPILLPVNTCTDSDRYPISCTALSGVGDVGDHSAPAFVDLDRDGDEDLFIGRLEGGLLFYRNATFTPLNQPPTVNAGPDQATVSPQSVALHGTVQGNGLAAQPLQTQWSQLSGPGRALFADASSVQTTARFTAQGIYRLRLTARAGEVVASDDLLVMVVPSPVYLARLFVDRKHGVTADPVPSMGAVAQWLRDRPCV